MGLVWSKETPIVTPSLEITESRRRVSLMTTKPPEGCPTTEAEHFAAIHAGAHA